MGQAVLQVPKEVMGDLAFFVLPAILVKRVPVGVPFANVRRASLASQAKLLVRLALGACTASPAQRHALLRNRLARRVLMRALTQLPTSFFAVHAFRAILVRTVQLAQYLVLMSALQDHMQAILLTAFPARRVFTARVVCHRA